MDPKALERIGILLTFFAGFLLAPELIGIKRIEDLQRGINTRLSNIEQSLQRRAGRLLPDSLVRSVVVIVVALLAIRARDASSKIALVILAPFAVVNFVLVMIAASVVLAPWLVLPELALVLGLLLLLSTRMRIYELRENPPTGSYSRLRRIVHFALAPVVGAGYVPGLISLAFGIWWFITLVIAGGIAHSMAKTMAGDGRLFSYMVGLGIICFIVGSLCQLVATF